MAQKAQLTSASNITWSDGSLFNGYVLLIMAPPTGYAHVVLRDKRPHLRVPQRYRVPIREGQYVPDTQVWRTDSLVPVNVRYSAFFYDSTDKLVSAGSSLFAVTSDPYTLAPPALTVPSAAVVSPTPETVPSAPVVVYQNVPTRENVSGTKNSINTAFSISRAGSVVFVIWNQMVLTEGVHYTRTGTSITMTVAPDSGDTLEAVIYG